jgi:hypothetical protein
MANNYTITSSVTSENEGDSVVNGTIPSSVALIITPDAGFVLQASDFAIGTTLPIEVTSVSFADTGTALDPANTIIATVTLASWYTMPSNADTIGIDIDGKPWRLIPRLSFFNTMATTIPNVTATLTIPEPELPKLRAYSGVVTDGITVHTCHVDLPANQLTKIGFVTISAAAEYHLTNMPSYRLSSGDSSKWNITTSSTTYNSDNQLTAIVYSVYYNMGSSKIDASLGENIIWSVPSATANRTNTVNISSAYYTGYKNESILPALNTDLQLNVVGNEGASYFVKVEDKNGLTYDFTSNTFTRELTSSSEQFIYHPNRQKLLGNNSNSNYHTISLPAYFKEYAYDFYFTTTVTPSASTYTDVAGTSTDPHIITLRQFGEVDYTLGVTTSTYGVSVASTIKSITNKTPLSTLPSYAAADFPRSRSYSNGSFSSTQTLGYTVSDDVAGESGTSITLTNTPASLKLQVGDSVTGTNVGSNRTITTIADPTARTIVLSGVDGTVSGTLVFTRTVGISRQPLVTDIFNIGPTGSYSPSYYDFSVIEAVTNSTLVKVEAAGASDIVVPMLVEGDNIIGYPTVVSQSNGIVILSQAQTIPLGETLTFSAAGRSLDISKLEVTGAGTADCKLIMEGSVLRMGNTDVTDALQLANFITTYAAPTIVAATATCPLNSSITIEPLSGCTGHTGNLTIADVPSKGAGAAVISGDGKSILYVAPATDGDMEDTITYTITDGVNTTSAEDIVITLTL